MDRTTFENQLLIQKSEWEERCNIYDTALKSNWKCNYAWRLNNLWVIFSTEYWASPISAYTLGMLYWGSYHLVGSLDALPLKRPIHVWDENFKYQGLYSANNTIHLL